MFKRLRKLFSIGRRNIACFVDGPNMLRKELGVELDKIRSRLQKEGSIKIAKVFVDQFASDKLIEAIVNQGFDVVIIPSDIDVGMAIEAMDAVYNPAIDCIAIVSRDSDFKPLLMKAKEKGLFAVAVGTDPDFSSSLKNSADLVINLRG